MPHKMKGGKLLWGAIYKGHLYKIQDYETHSPFVSRNLSVLLVHDLCTMLRLVWAYFMDAPIR